MDKITINDKAKELLLKHLYNHGGDSLGISDGKVYMACIDAIQEALAIKDKCKGCEYHTGYICLVCTNKD